MIRRSGGHFDDKIMRHNKKLIVSTRSDPLQPHNTIKPRPPEPRFRVWRACRNRRRYTR
jgi:hypothetical protein